MDYHSFGDFASPPDAPSSPPVQTPSSAIPAAPAQAAQVPPPPAAVILPVTPPWWERRIFHVVAFVIALLVVLALVGVFYLLFPKRVADAVRVATNSQLEPVVKQLSTSATGIDTAAQELKTVGEEVRQGMKQAVVEMKSAVQQAKQEELPPFVARAVPVVISPPHPLPSPPSDDETLIVHADDLRAAGERMKERLLSPRPVAGEVLDTLLQGKFSSSPSPPEVVPAVPSSLPRRTRQPCSRCGKYH